MVLNGDGKMKTEIKLNGEVLKEVEKFKYLGSWITTNGGHMTDIKCRIADTKIAFADMKNILANLKMLFDLRYRIFNCYVMPILLYGCENWILNQQQIKRLEATEMWFIRRMQKISWKEKKTNEQVLRETIGKRKLIQKIVQQQVPFFGHVMRKGQLEHIVTTAKINGKRKRGKPSVQYVDQIKKWTQQESIESLMSKIYERTLLVAQVYWQGTQRRRRSFKRINKISSFKFIPDSKVYVKTVPRQFFIVIININQSTLTRSITLSIFFQRSYKSKFSVTFP